MSRPVIALLRKDLRITRVFWAPMTFSYGVFLLMFMENVWIYLTTGVCLAFVAAATALGIDDRYRTEPLFAALPVTRRSLVAGRYLAWGVLTAAGLALFLAFAVLIDAGLSGRDPRLAALVSVKGAVAFLAGTLTAGAAFLPFHFRLGFWRGIWAFIAAGFVLSAAALSAIGRFAPVIAPVEAPASLPIGPLVSTGQGLRVLAWLIDRHLGRPAVVAAAAAALMLLACLSYILSVNFYAKRDL